MMKNHCSIFACSLASVILFGFLELVNANSLFDPETWRYGRKVCKCSCGVPYRAEMVEERLVGGQPTDAYEYPWMAGILFKGILYCGGTLISDLHVLTAAHCIDGTNYEHLHIFFGAYDFDKIDTSIVQLRSIRKIITHPNFVRKTFNNDIAIIELNSSVLFSGPIGPACLPESEVEYDGKIAIVTGWGRIAEGGQVSSVLRQIQVPVMNNTACQKFKYSKKSITSNMFCAGYAKGQIDACQGDSGGPIQIKRKDNKIELIGIVSWGHGCGRAGYPGVYTRLGRYLEWIARSTYNGCYCGKRTGRYG